MYDSFKSTLRLCESSAKLRKNVIGGAIGDYVFQHRLTNLVVQNLTKKKRIPTQLAQVFSFRVD